MVRPDPGPLQAAIRHAEAMVNRGIDTSNAKALAKMRNALINLEKVAEEARKQVIEPALDDEMDRNILSAKVWCVLTFNRIFITRGNLRLSRILEGGNPRAESE